MNIKTIIFSLLESIIKIAILILAITYIYRGVIYAYDFGYKVFADEPMSSTNGRTITVGIGESADVSDIAAMLQEKGLIRDSRLFQIQEYLSAYHGDIKPGIYDLSTSMTANEMLEIMSSGTTDEDKASSDNIVDNTSKSEAKNSESEETSGEVSEDISDENTEETSDNSVNE